MNTHLGLRFLQQKLRPLFLVSLCLVIISLTSACDLKLPHRGHGLRKIAHVIFSPPLPTDSAVEIVSNLGLQPADFCYELSQTLGGRIGWRPIMGNDSAELYLDTLPVAVTLMAPTDWLTRLRALPGIAEVKTDVYPSCGTAVAEPAEQPVPPPTPQDVRLTFKSGVSYDLALDTIYTLGLQLTDPCDEAIIRAGGHPLWHPQGQQAYFASQHALLALVTILVPPDWRARLQAAPNVTSIQDAWCF